MACHAVVFLVVLIYLNPTPNILQYRGNCIVFAVGIFSFVMVNFAVCEHLFYFNISIKKLTTVCQY